MRALDRPPFDDSPTSTTDAASDLRSRIPAQSLIEQTLLLHGSSPTRPTEDAGSSYAGAVGAIAVAGVLSWLGPEWTVLHSVPVRDSDSDIDHLVIGPPGVFTISTRNHAGQRIWISGWSLFVSGHATSYIVRAEAEAEMAAELLSAAAGLVIPVKPLIVLVSPGERRVKSDPAGGVRIAADWELLGALQSRREFSDVQLERIVAAATSPSTWRSAPLLSTDPRALTVRFNALLARTEVAAELVHVATPGARAVRRSSGSIEALAAPLDDDSEGFGESTPLLRLLQSGRLKTALAELTVIGISAWAIFGVAIPILQGALFR